MEDGEKERDYMGSNKLTNTKLDLFSPCEVGRFKLSHRFASQNAYFVKIIYDA